MFQRCSHGMYVWRAEVLTRGKELSANEAGQLSALVTAISTCIGTMHMWCMPCTKSASRPSNPQHTLNCAAKDLEV